MAIFYGIEINIFFKKKNTLFPNIYEKIYFYLSTLLNSK